VAIWSWAHLRTPVFILWFSVCTSPRLSLLLGVFLAQLLYKHNIIRSQRPTWMDFENTKQYKRGRPKNTHQSPPPLGHLIDYPQYQTPRAALRPGTSAGPHVMPEHNLSGASNDAISQRLKSGGRNRRRPSFPPPNTSEGPWIHSFFPSGKNHSCSSWEHSELTIVDSSKSSPVHFPWVYFLTSVWLLPSPLLLRVSG
jgi:hypothetical protein